MFNSVPARNLSGSQLPIIHCALCGGRAEVAQRPSSVFLDIRCPRCDEPLPVIVNNQIDVPPVPPILARFRRFVA